MRTALKTVRLRPEESRWVEAFLEKNRWIQSFSELARLAILDFVQRRGEIPIQPIAIRSKREAKREDRPLFLWDYDMSREDVQTQLRSKDGKDNCWLIARILGHAPFDDIWDYLTVEDIRRVLPALRMDPKRKRHWELALETWAEK